MNCLMKRALIEIGILLSFWTFPGYGRECLPEPTDQLVYDLTGQLDLNNTAEYLYQLYEEQAIQIVVVVADTLCGLDLAMYANELGHRWGVGNPSLDDGVVIVLVPKGPERNGALFVAPGRGVQGVLTDSYVKQLVRQTIADYFRKNDYDGGLTFLIERVAEGIRKARAEEPNLSQPEASASGKRLLWWLLMFGLSGVVYGYVFSQGGLVRLDREARKKWRETVLEVGGLLGIWGGIMGWVTGSLWTGILAIGAGAAMSVLGYAVAPRGERTVRWIATVTERVLLVLAFPIVLVGLLGYLMFKYGEPIQKQAEVIDSRKKRTSAGRTSRTRSIRFGGGRFNGGGAGGSW